LEADVGRSLEADVGEDVEVGADVGADGGPSGIDQALRWIESNETASSLFCSPRGAREVLRIAAGEDALWRAACLPPEAPGGSPSLVVNLDSGDGPGGLFCSLVHEARHAAQLEAGVKDPNSEPKGSLLLLAILEADAVAAEAVAAVRIGRAGVRAPVEESSNEPDFAHVEAVWLATRLGRPESDDSELHALAFKTAFKDPVRNLLLAFGHADRTYAPADMEEAQAACSILSRLPLEPFLSKSVLATSPFRLDGPARFAALAAGLARAAAERAQGTERIGFLAKARSLESGAPSPKSCALAAGLAAQAAEVLDEPALAPAVLWLRGELASAAKSLASVQTMR